MRIRMILFSSALFLCGCGAGDNDAAPKSNTNVTIEEKTIEPNVKIYEYGINFTANYATEKFQGSFNALDAKSLQINFNTHEPENIEIQALIATNDMTANDPDRDAMIPSKDWFDVKNHPNALLVVAAGDSKLIHMDDDTSDDSFIYHMESNAKLIIRDVALPVKITYTIVEQATALTATGTAKIDRVAYGLGTSIDSDTIGQFVDVQFTVDAEWADADITQ